MPAAEVSACAGRDGRAPGGPGAGGPVALTGRDGPLTGVIGQVLQAGLALDLEDHLADGDANGRNEFRAKTRCSWADAGSARTCEPAVICVTAELARYRAGLTCCARALARLAVCRDPAQAGCPCAAHMPDGRVRRGIQVRGSVLADPFCSPDRSLPLSPNGGRLRSCTLMRRRTNSSPSTGRARFVWFVPVLRARVVWGLLPSSGGSIFASRSAMLARSAGVERAVPRAPRLPARRSHLDNHPAPTLQAVARRLVCPRSLARNVHATRQQLAAAVAVHTVVASAVALVTDSWPAP